MDDEYVVMKLINKWGYFPYEYSLKHLAGMFDENEIQDLIPGYLKSNILFNEEQLCFLLKNKRIQEYEMWAYKISDCIKKINSGHSFTAKMWYKDSMYQTADGEIVAAYQYLQRNIPCNIHYYVNDKDMQEYVVNGDF